MKLLKLLLLFLLISCKSNNKKVNTKYDISKTVMSDICNAISSASFELKNATDYELLNIQKFIGDETKKIEPTEKEQLKKTLHSECPDFHEFINIINGKKDIFKIWKTFTNKKTNTQLWNVIDRDEYLDLCNYSSSYKNLDLKICNCVLNQISSKFSSEEFNSLSIDEQGHLSGMIRYAYCN